MKRKKATKRCFKRGCDKAVYKGGRCKKHFLELLSETDPDDIKIYGAEPKQ